MKKFNLSIICFLFLLPCLALAQNPDYWNTLETVNQYVRTYSYDSSAYAPNWECLGPTGTPSGSNPARGVGQINRLVFDPQYSRDTTDAGFNQTIYAISHFGGIWRSENAGDNWENVNSDVAFPHTNIGDLAISHQNSDILFAATGDGDTGFRLLFEPNRGLLMNPCFTAGVYRSLDYGMTWSPINGLNQEFLDNFATGHSFISRIVVNPQNDNQVFVASSKGIFKTENALAPSEEVKWIHCLKPDLTKAFFQNWRGLAFHPANPDIVYASGPDIYISTNGGNSWQPMTGGNAGLDFDSLYLEPHNDFFCDNTNDGCKEIYDANCEGANPGKKIPRHFIPRVINITTSPANPDALFAYILGQEEYREKKTLGGLDYKGHCNEYGKIQKRNRAYIFICQRDGRTGDMKWEEVHSTLEWGTSFSRMAIAVSPVNPKQLFYGAVQLKGNDHTRTDGRWIFSSRARGNGKTFHVDIHALAFEPNTENPTLFIGHDGGISEKYNLEDKKGSLRYRNNGLAVAKIWTFDNSNAFSSPLKAAIGLQDCGVVVLEQDSAQEQGRWRIIQGGDGYGAQIDDRSNLLYFKANGTLGRFDGNTKKVDIEANNASHWKAGNREFRPMDLKKHNLRAILPSTFKIKNQPNNGLMLWGFGEVYLRKQAIPEKEHRDNPELLWAPLTDYGKILPEEWKRKIFEFDFCESNPDVLYLVNAGFPSEKVPTEIYQINVANWTDEVAFEENRYRVFREEFRNQVLLRKIPMDAIPGKGPFGIDYPIITGITVHPEKPNVFWICFAGYNAAAKVFKGEFNPGNGQVTWTDEASLSLNNLPANGIVYQKGSQDRLYLATDAGIYVKDSSMAEWEKYGDFPNVRTLELKIDYCQGKLMAATFGRGLWQGDLLPTTSLGADNSWFIRGEEVVESELVVERDIVILAGSELIIRGRLSMPANGQIRIRPGGALNLDGGLVTNNCDQKWKGVQLDNPTGFFTRLFLRRGSIFLNGGRIEGVEN